MGKRETTTSSRHFIKFLQPYIGKRYGRWTVLAIGARRSGTRELSARCDCGSTRETLLLNSLVSGISRSCGCLQRELASHTHRKHGQSFARTYTTWSHMRQRCTNSQHHQFHNYGGRGIYVCERWQTFENFLADMGERPAGMSIDRIDNDGDYEPGNCRWATMREQRNNTQDTTYITYQGRTQSAREWAEELGVDRHTLYLRKLRYGWSDERIITTPVRRWVRDPDKVKAASKGRK